MNCQTCGKPSAVVPEGWSGAVCKPCYTEELRVIRSWAADEGVAIDEAGIKVTMLQLMIAEELDNATR